MKYIILIICILCFHISNAQDSSATTAVQIKAGLNYISALHYYGRTDSMQSQGFFPAAELWLREKFYLNIAPVFTYDNRQKPDYAGTVATLGYQAMSKKWITSVYLLKPFYHSSAPLVQSSLQAQAGMNLTRRTKILNFTAGMDFKYSDQPDAGALAGIDRLIFKKGKKGTVWVLDPSAYIHGGTRNFSGSYTRKKSSFLLFPGEEEIVNTEVKRFQLLSLEFSMPVIFIQRNLMLMAIPAYIMPQNLLENENGSRIFSVTATIKYTFRFKRPASNANPVH